MYHVSCLMYDVCMMHEACTHVRLGSSSFTPSPGYQAIVFLRAPAGVAPRAAPVCSAPSPPTYRGRARTCARPPSTRGSSAERATGPHATCPSCGAWLLQPLGCCSRSAVAAAWLFCSRNCALGAWLLQPLALHPEDDAGDEGDPVPSRLQRLPAELRLRALLTTVPGAEWQ